MQLHRRHIAYYSENYIFTKTGQQTPETDVIDQQKFLTRHDEIAGKSFVKEDGQVTIVCPQCNSLKTVPVAQYRERQHKLKVKCSCSHVFKVNLDFRQCYRKPTSLTGTYNMFPPATGGGLAKIHNLSLSGICFEVKGIHNLRTGQKGYIDFTLDNKKTTHLHKEFIIRSVQDNIVGCEFKKDAAFEKELGFYMRFES
jgi:hypothetical protein